MPQDPLASSFTRASAALRAGDFRAAEQIFREIVDQDPTAADAWLGLAVTSMRGAAPAVAVQYAERAVALDGDNALYLNNLGIAHGECGDYTAAERAFQAAVANKPEYAEAHYNLAKTLHKQGRLDESLREYERVYALQPTSVPAQLGLVGMYRLQGQTERALSLLRDIGKSAPLAPPLGPHYARCLADVEGPDSAIAWLRQELARNPDAASAHHFLAVLLLSVGNWREGWTEYLWRSHPQPKRAKPSLSGEARGRRVLLRADQGLGDVVFFMRFVDQLRARGAVPALDCPTKLVPLLAGSIELGAQGHDLEVSIGDLPALLGAEDVVPPFRLRPDEARCSRMRETLAALGKPPYLGVTWQAGTDVLHRREFGADMGLLFKQIPPDLLGKALRGWPGTVLSLQREPIAADVDRFREGLGAPAADLGAANEDLEEMLALLSLLDEYVAVSNTNIHLLAGLGRTARVLVPHPPEWRWMHQGNSPWFPGFQLYRQTKQLHWTDALKRLRHDLGSPPRARA